MSFLRLSIIVGLCCAFAAEASAQNDGPVPTIVLHDNSAQAKEIETRVFLDSRFAQAKIDQAQLIWVLGVNPVDDWAYVLERVRSGAGLVLVAGRKLPDLSDWGLIPSAQKIKRATLVLAQKNRPSLTKAYAQALLHDPQWETAPQGGLRWVFERLAKDSPVRPLIRQQQGSPLVFVGKVGRGRVALVGLQLVDPSNRELILWPSFNYFAYGLSSYVAQRPVQRFADWEHSPVPGKSSLWIMLPLLGLGWLVTLLLFFAARRHARKHPEALSTFFKGAIALRRAKPAGAQWRSIGFSRPLAGFLTLTALLFLIFAPWYWLTNILLPNDVQPFPQAKGIWDFAWEALQVAWFLFDAGTFVAFIKYFAEFRLKDPQEAVRSAQFFVWWQILTGLVQVTFACIAAVVILPHTRYGFSSNFVILVALGQYPGFFGVLTFFFQAYQRFDYNIGLDLLSDWILRFVLQVPFVLLFRAWGMAHPEYGEALGAAIGIGVGYHVSALVTFGIGVLLYRRLGLRLLPLFLVHFDIKTAKRMLWYGLRVVLGKVFYRAAQTIDKVVISLLLANYTEWLGLKSQINLNLMFLFPIAYRFFETAMAALSESYGNEKKTLTQYYIVRFFQVGSLYTAIGLSLMVALGPAFVRGAMDPQWGRAANYLLLAGLVGAFFAPAWLSDMLQKGAGRPGLFAIVLGLEQAVRIGLFYLLIPKWQFYGFYLAILITIVLKVVGAWIVNHLLIIRVRVFIWQMLLAPAIAGVANFALLRVLAWGMVDFSRWELIIAFFVAALLSFLICFFVTGLAGGFDRQFAHEFEQAAGMGGVLKPLTRLFYFCAKAGWRFSPLHNRFPVTIAADALAEAKQLEQKRQQVDGG